MKKADLPAGWRSSPSLAALKNKLGGLDKLQAWGLDSVIVVATISL